MAENHQFERKPPQAAQTLKWFLLLAALTVSFYWKLLLTDQYVWFDHPDMAYLELPRLSFEAREIHAGRFPLWDPHIWMGQPFIGQTQPGPLFPLNLAFGKTSLRGGYPRFSWLNVYWALLHFLAAWFFFLLARDLSLSREAALGGACIFGFGGFIGSVAWLDVLNGAIWAPLILMFVLRAGRGRATWRDSALGGLFLGVAWLSGHHEMPILTSAAMGVTWLWLARRDRRLLAHAVFFFAIAILIAGAQLLPTIEFGRLSRRWIGLENTLGWKDKVPYLNHEFYSLTPRALLGVVIPKLGGFADTSVYIGWVAGAMAFTGAAFCWSQRIVRWAAALLAVSTIYSLGVFTPLNGVLYALFPLMDKARIPARGILLIHLAISILAAYGLDKLLAEKRPARRVGSILLWVGLAVLAGTLTSPLLVDGMHVLGAMAALAAAAVLAGWRRGALSRPVVAASLVSLILIELTGGAPSAWLNRHSKDAGKFTAPMTGNQDIAAYLKSADAGPTPRVAVDDNALGANFGDWHGVDMYQGYVAGVSENLTRHEMHLPRTQDLFGVTHWLGKDANREGQQLAFTGQSGLKLFRNPTVMPRVRTVHRTHTVSSDGELRIALQNPAIDLAQTAVFLGKAPALETCEGATAIRWQQETTDRWRIEAELPCRGLVVVSNTFYPGWEARVDGNPAPVIEAYGALQSVVVEKGKHVLELRFRPASVYKGAGMTLLGLALAAIACRRRVARKVRV